jgi:hypothetical protein
MLPKTFSMVDIRQPDLYQEFIEDFDLEASAPVARRRSRIRPGT